MMFKGSLRIETDEPINFYSYGDIKQTTDLSIAGFGVSKDAVLFKFEDFLEELIALQPCVEGNLVFDTLTEAYESVKQHGSAVLRGDWDLSESFEEPSIKVSIEVIKQDGDFDMVI